MHSQQKAKELVNKFGVKKANGMANEALKLTTTAAKEAYWRAVIYHIKQLKTDKQ